MNFYLFNSDFNLIDKLEDIGFTGNLFIYNTNQSDFFTQIAKNLDVNKKIKYMVATRPYVTSPEHLVNIHKSIREIATSDERLQINLISGHIKENEENIIRTIGEVNNRSTSIEKSNYLIKYLDILNDLPDGDKPDYYVSVTNNFTFDTAKKYNNKMIIGYSHYISNYFDLTNTRTMISVTAIIRKTQEELDNLEEYNIQHKSDLSTFTYSQMTQLINRLKDDGIEEIIFSAWNAKDTEEIINFVDYYNQNNKEKSK